MEFKLENIDSRRSTPDIQPHISKFATLFNTAE